MAMVHDNAVNMAAPWCSTDQRTTDYATSFLSIPSVIGIYCKVKRTFLKPQEEASRLDNGLTCVMLNSLWNSGPITLHHGCNDERRSTASAAGSGAAFSG